MALLFAYPISALADVKIILNPPGYKYNPYGYKQYSPKYYSNKYKYNKYKYKKHHYKKKKYNKYDFAPYSYKSKQYDYSHGKKQFYYPKNIVRPSYNRIYNYNPYAHNYNKYQHQKEKAYWQGYRDGYHQNKRHYKLGK